MPSVVRSIVVANYLVLFPTNLSFLLLFHLLIENMYPPVRRMLDYENALVCSKLLHSQGIVHWCIAWCRVSEMFYHNSSLFFLAFPLNLIRTCLWYFSMTTRYQFSHDVSFREKNNIVITKHLLQVFQYLVGQKQTKGNKKKKRIIFSITNAIHQGMHNPVF